MFILSELSSSFLVFLYSSSQRYLNGVSAGFMLIFNLFFSLLSYISEMINNLCLRTDRLSTVFTLSPFAARALSLRNHLRSSCRCCAVHPKQWMGERKQVELCQSLLAAADCIHERRDFRDFRVQISWKNKWNQVSAIISRCLMLLFDIWRGNYPTSNNNSSRAIVQHVFDFCDSECKIKSFLVFRLMSWSLLELSVQLLLSESRNRENLKKLILFDFCAVDGMIAI